MCKLVFMILKLCYVGHVTIIIIIITITIIIITQETIEVL